MGVKKFLPRLRGEGLAMSVTAEVSALPRKNFAQLSTRFDREYGVYWAYMNARPRACFTVELLSDLQQYLVTIAESHVQPSGDHEVQYGVLASKTRGIFNLGG